MIVQLRHLAAGACLALVLVTSGCTDDDPDARPDPSSSAGATSTPSAASPSPDATTATTDPTDLPPPYAAAVPATGLELTAATTRIATPAEWGAKARDVVSDSSGSAGGGTDLRDQLLLDDVERDVNGDESIDSLARFYRRASLDDPKLPRVADLTILGIPAFHLSGDQPDLRTHVDTVGLRHDGRSITIIISTPIETPAVQRDATVGSILASFAFTA